MNNSKNKLFLLKSAKTMVNLKIKIRERQEYDNLKPKIMACTCFLTKDAI